MGLFSKKQESQQGYQEGDIVAQGDDTFRVRRNYGEHLELVNHTGYHVAPTTQVEQTYYCGICRCMREISHFPH
jgi:hypothetical protein